MRQLLYISSIKPRLVKPIDLEAILEVSRHNNASSNVTGLLFFNGRRFLQALEGQSADVDATFERIQKDPRHHALVILSTRVVQSREFGTWAMAYRDEDNAADDDMLARVAQLVSGAAPSIRGTFDSFVRFQRAA
ncbi:BLUF domain-containing protein [Novosphingopyxis sp.]|uniref:BLUF domain-containing protein n=1 Tax=Novosphingopyxis sp. TaxID=2709690 RepID=UPI003B5BD959